LFTSGFPIAVAHDTNGHLLAFVKSVTGASTVEYISKDGGRTWHD
jgi:hypothetical protein